MKLSPISERSDVLKNARARLIQLLRGSDLTISCLFEGEIKDVDALDYLDYEGYLKQEHIFDASLIIGDILARNSNLIWATFDGSWWLTTPEESSEPKIVLSPYSRLLELHLGNVPQFNKCMWSLETMIAHLVAHCWEVPGDTVTADLLQICRKDGAFAGFLSSS